MYAQGGVKLTTQPEIGKRIAVPRTAEVGLCMSSPGQMDKCFKATVNGIKFMIAYRRSGPLGNVVTYVHTDDPGFTSPEGLRVGDVVSISDPESIIAAPGFEIYGRKGKGWVPVVGFNGQVEVVQQGKSDENREVKSLTPTSDNPVLIRIKSFTMRGTLSKAQEPTATMG